jgi:ribonuclease-3 family protein
LIDYKYATGFECLMGYLYLSGRDERLMELFEDIKKIKG